ncbi:MAG: anhydro-N-acetylmuramic acid kinase, partial [Cyanobacteria bacterium]|nr:anhydro-N-acetylmuramic acid kinase [Cyanobacteriota bacterium]
KSGNLHEGLFNSLKSDPYLQKQPPKTTGREYYSLHFLEPLLEKFSEASPQDIIHTLTYFTAFSIYNAYQHFIFPHHVISEMVIGGGGLYNATLMDMLNQLFQTSHPDFKITDHEAYGVPSKYKEALAFGILAWATGIQLPNNIPSCTGARHPVILGQLTPV